jgi:hypothetical protein
MSAVWFPHGPCEIALNTCLSSASLQIPIKEQENIMRRVASVTATLIATLSALTAVVSTAQAIEPRRPIQIDVQKRSFLDAGKVVPVGTYSRYVDAANSGGSFLHSGNISNLGRENLPDRFAGPNPFANSFYGPSLR